MSTNTLYVTVECVKNDGERVAFVAREVPNSSYSFPVESFTRIGIDPQPGTYLTLKFTGMGTVFYGVEVSQP